MTSRNYDILIKVSNSIPFRTGNIVTGASSNSVGVIASKDDSNNIIKVKLANTLSGFTSGETIRSNSTTIAASANAFFDYAVMPYSPNTVSGNIITATSTITSITPSTFIAEKNSFTQNPIVRLYSLYYPGDWYPTNANGNPGNGQGVGRAWPNEFPMRFAEIIGDLVRDISYNVSYGGISYTPLPVNLTGLDQSSDGKVNEASVTLYNFDNMISRLVENSTLVGNNIANSIQAIVNGEWVHGIDPRTVKGSSAAWNTEFGTSDPRAQLLSRARSNGLSYADEIVTLYGKANASFTRETTLDVNGIWQSQKSDTRDLLGGVLEVKTTFANFLDFWPEYSIISSTPINNTAFVQNSLPYRVGDRVTRPGVWSDAYITGLGLRNDITLSRPFAKILRLDTRDNSPRGITFSSDGSNVYIVGHQFNRLHQYSLSTPWDISTATYMHNISLSLDSLIQTVQFDASGSNVYTINQTNDNARQYALSTAWNVMTASLTCNLNVSTFETSPTGLTFSNTGANAYVVGPDRDNVVRFSLSTPWRLDTATFVSNAQLGTSANGSVFGAHEILFNTTGNKMLVLDNNRDSLYTYNLSTPWDPMTLSLEGNVALTQYTNNCFGMVFGEGSNLYITTNTNHLGIADNNVYQLPLSIPFTANSFYTAGSSWAPVGTPIRIINDFADPDSFVEDKFKIDQLESLSEYVATFGLVSWLQYFKMATPRRKYYKNTCQWVYKGSECQYPSTGVGAIAGSTYSANGFFTAGNVPTAVESEDICSKSLTACTLRNNFLRFGGFPGVGRTIPRM